MINSGPNFRSTMTHLEHQLLVDVSENPEALLDRLRYHGSLGEDNDFAILTDDRRNATGYVRLNLEHVGDKVAATKLGKFSLPTTDVAIKQLEVQTAQRLEEATQDGRPLLEVVRPQPHYNPGQPGQR